MQLYQDSFGDNAEVRDQKIFQKAHTRQVPPKAQKTVMDVWLGAKHYIGDLGTTNTNHDHAILYSLLFPGPVTIYSRLKEIFQYLAAFGTK